MVGPESTMRVGLIGAGLQGRRRTQALAKSKDSELVIVASGHLERAQELAGTVGCQSTDNWEEVVSREDVEVVLVCTPPNVHEVMCVRALEAGKHVLCEKPLARTPEECQRIVDSASRNGCKLKCGFNHRHHPAIKQARDWSDQGIIAEPYFVRCRYGIGGRPGFDEEWRANREISGGGELLDQGMHAIDLARWFLGDFTEATGFVHTYFWDMAPLEDNAFFLLRTERGQVASIHVSWTQWKNLFSFELFGKDGYILVEGLGSSYGVEKAVLGKRAFLEPFREQTIEFRGADTSWDEEWEEFKSAIREGREPMANGRDGLEAVRLAYATYEAARRGGTRTNILDQEVTGQP